MPSGKVACTGFVWCSLSLGILYSVLESRPCDTLAVGNWAVDGLGELAKVSIAAIGLSGQDGCRDGGGAQDESDD